LYRPTTRARDPRGTSCLPTGGSWKREEKTKEVAIRTESSRARRGRKRVREDLLVDAVRPDGVVEEVLSIAGVETRVESLLLRAVVSLSLPVVNVSVGLLLVHVVGDSDLSDAGKEEEET